MPKIPTFTAQGRPTAESTGVVSNIKVNVNQSVAAALRPLGKTAEDFYIKKRNIEEKLIANKAILELQSESDKIVQSQKENIVEEDAINNWKNTFTPLIQQKISSIKNRRVKNLIETGIDLQNAESIYQLKKNSFTALQSDSLENINNKITYNISKYATTDNPILKVQYKVNTKNDIKSFAEEFNLPKNVLDKKLKAADRDFLLSDINQFAGLVNGAEQINNLDISSKGTDFLNNEEFGVGVFNAYNNKISEITIKGNPDSNYDRALKLVDELKNFKRKANGYKVDTGKFSVDIDNLEQKILTEQIQHNNLMNKQVDNKAFLDFSNDSKISLLKTITDNKAGIPPTLEDRLIANEIESEYDQMVRDYLDADPEASLPNKKSFVRNLTSTLNNIYQDRKISKIKSRSFTEDTFDIVAEKNRVMEDVKLLALGELDITTRRRYEKIAKANGYITTVTQNDKQQKIGDIGAFLNEYLPTLERQIKAIEIAE